MAFRPQRSRWRPALPPRAGGRFFSTAFWQARQDPLRFYLDAWRQFGDVVRFESLGRRWFLAAHPEAVRHVLINNAANYRKPAILLRPLRLLFGNNLFTSEGENWQRFRRWAQPPLRRGTGQTIWSAAVNQAVEETLSDWKKKPGGRLADLRAEMTLLALRAICYSLFGCEIHLDFQALVDAIGVALRYLGHRTGRTLCLPLWVPSTRNREFLQARRLLEESITELIREQQTEPRARDGLLSHLLSSQRRGKEASEQLLRELLLTLIVAAAESMGTALCWTWLLLAQHPAAERKLLAERSSSPGIEDRIRPGQVEIPFARMIFQETLRLYPTAWVQPRQALAADTLQGFAVPRGTVIVLSQYLTHRHPDFWDAPDEFMPERFGPERMSDKNRLAYFPFGLGCHLCPGMEFALLAGPMILAALAIRYRLEPETTHMPEVKAGSFFLEPDGIIAAVLHERMRLDGAARNSEVRSAPLVMV